MDYRAFLVVKVIRLRSSRYLSYEASVETIKACRKVDNILCRLQLSIDDFIIEREFDGEIHLLFFL